MLRNLNQSSAGRRILGTHKSGVLGALIPSTGDNQGGYCYDDLNLPADNAREICGRITSWPGGGTLTAYEDTSFEFSGAADNTYTFTYQLYVDGVATGPEETVTLQFGALTHTASGSLLAGLSSVSGSASRTVGVVTHAASGALVSVAATLAGSATRAGSPTLHDASGMLSALSASVIGSAIRTGSATAHDASGSLVSVSATVSGTATRTTTGFSGSLSQADIDAIADAVWAHPNAPTSVSIANAVWAKILP